MRQVKPGTLYTSPFSMAYWRDAAAELRDTRILVFAALMIALRVALKSLGIPIAADLKINIAFFVNAFGAMVFGPVVANTPIMWLYYKMVLGKSYAIFQLPRIIKNLALFPLESVLLVLFLTAMMPVGARFGLLYDKGENLRLRKRQVALLVTLFVVGAACVGGYYVYNYNTTNHASKLPAAEVASINSALTRLGADQNLLDDGQVVTVSKVYKKLGGDTTVEFTVYQTSAETDLNAAAGYLEKSAKADETMTKVASGSAVLPGDDAAAAGSMTVQPES